METPKPTHKIGEDPAKDDAYAQSLLKMVNADYEVRQAQNPGAKHLVSKKMLIWIVVSLVITILIWVGTSVFAKSQS